MHHDPARRVFDAVLPDRLAEPQAARVHSPSNIALSKYWGKRDAPLNLPLNSSVSISLGDWGTTTQITPATEDRLIFNGQELAPTAPAAAKVWHFVERFRRGQTAPLHIKTDNTIPTAAGLASSASGFAALTDALDQAFALSLPRPVLSMLARFGSGSATRSLWHGFVRWDRGHQEDGSDSHAVPLDVVWPQFRIAILAVDTGPKAQSSRDGMAHTVDTSPLFATWPQEAERDCAEITDAIQAREFDRLGARAEANALAMHATMMAARPSLCYLKSGSWALLETLWSARQDGLAAYATMDAGANVKLIFEEASASDIGALFPDAQIIAPFDVAI